MQNIILLIIHFLFSFSPPSADIILYNGKIVTVNDNFSIVEAIAIHGDTILDIGTTKHIMALKGRSTKMIDLKGKTVVPGLVDAHAHPVPASQSEFKQKIPDVHTIAELLSWIKKQTTTTKKGEWIVHPKFFITRMRDMRQLTLHELDSVAPHHPVFLNGSFGGMVNTRALKLSGLWNSGHKGILRNPGTNQPLGLIQSSIFPLLARKLSAPLKSEEQMRLLAELFSHYNQLGITSIISGGGDSSELAVYESLNMNNKLNVRVYHNMIFGIKSPFTDSQVQQTLTNFNRKSGDGNSMVKVGAFKLVVDGGVLTGTAYMRHGWGEKAKDVYGINDPAYRGNIFYSKDELKRLITIAANHKWKFSAHVTGGGAVDTLLAAFEEVDTLIHVNGRRFSIIHGNFFNEAAIAKMADMDVYADMQPAWYLKDADLLDRVLDEEEINSFHPYRFMIDKRITINGGSDHMVKIDPDESINPYNPFLAMWSMITRKTERGSIYNEEQAISRQEALRCYTINNAMATFEEKIKGSLEKGKLADLAVLSNDLLTCNADSIKNIVSELTIVNGRIVYQRK